MSDKPRMETAFEKGLFGARWLIAPMYLGLSVALAMLTVIFLRELLHYAPELLTMTAEKMILVVLTLIDLTLAANLLLIVLFSGYENFVSKLDIDDHADRPEWMGKVDFSGLKMKLIASIVAISAIHLLKKFMEIGDSKTPTAIGDNELFWLTAIHLTFVVSGVLMAAMDWLTAKAKTKY
ncbi:MAG: TIGR00645 family protein [Paracoccaceae bacterium]